MPQRKSWTQEEDRALKSVLDNGIKKWNTVARLLQDFNIFGRTGKQCRQRWHNQLDPRIVSSSWTPEEEEQLYRLHNQLGNAWAKISHRLKGRTDNSIKNHFYSTLRKALRKINKYIQETKSHNNKEFKPGVLTKLLAAAEDKFDKKLKLPREVVQRSITLKNQLIQFSREENNDDSQKAEELIMDIHDYAKTWKRKKRKGKKIGAGFEQDDIENDFESSNQVIRNKPPPEVKIENAPQPNAKIRTRQSNAQIIVTEAEPKNLFQRRLSKRESRLSRHSGNELNFNKLRSNFQQDDGLRFMRRRSSSRSNMSFVGNYLYPKFSDFELPRAGLNLGDSMSNLGNKNLFESDFVIERLND